MEAPSPFEMPIFIVDDDLEAMLWIDDFQEAFAPTEITGFKTMAEAESRLLAEPQEPFILVMDYDFEKNASESNRKGDELVAKIRRNHLYGDSLPILMLSGKLNDQNRINMTQERSWKGPSAFAVKAMLTSGQGIPTDFVVPKQLESVAEDLLPRYLFLASILLRLQDAFMEQRAVDAAQAARAEAQVRAFVEDDSFE